MPNLNFGCFSLTVGNPPWMSFLKNLLDFFFVVSRICRQISDVVAVERIRFWLFLFLFRRFFSLARAWASGEGRLRFGSGLDFSRIRHWSKICRQNSKQTLFQENLSNVLKTTKCIWTLQYTKYFSYFHFKYFCKQWFRWVIY